MSVEISSLVGLRLVPSTWSVSPLPSFEGNLATPGSITADKLGSSWNVSAMKSFDKSLTGDGASLPMKKPTYMGQDEKQNWTNRKLNNQELSCGRMSPFLNRTLKFYNILG